MNNSIDIKFKGIFDKMDQIVYISDPETYEIIYANEKVHEVFSNNIIGKKCYKVLQNLDSPCSFCTNDKLFGEYPISPYIWEHYNENVKRWYHCIDQAIDWKAEKKVRLELAIDITQHKESEKKLFESEKRYRDIVENTKDAIIVFLLEGNKINISPQLTKILGMPEDIIMKEIFNLIHPDDFKQIMILFKNAIKNLSENMENIFDDIEFRARHMNGHYVWLSSSSKNYYDDEGNIIGFIASLRDISRKKMTEQKLKQSEEIFRSISEQSLMGIFIIQNGIKYANDKTLEIFGYSWDEMNSWETKDLNKLVHPEDLPNLLNVFVEFRERKKENLIFDLILRIINKSGEIKWTEIFSKPIIYKGEIAVLNIFHDITDRKEAEQRLEQSEEEYRKAFNRVTFLKEIVAHDFNNILNNIGSAIQLIDDFQENKKKLDEMYELIKDQVLRGGKLITNIQKLSEFEDQDMTIEVLKINDILDESIKYIKKSYKNREILIAIESKNEDFFVLANSLLLDVFENIIINSIKYNNNEIIEIKIKLSKFKSEGLKFIKIELIDNGIGIPDNKKARIFVREYKKDILSKGMGVGLSLVKKAIESYYGQIWIEDRVKGDHSKGTNFTILIPQAE
ncbi:MAG: PAS domain S-box protein [Promethearchaeota archaeon]